MKVRKLESHFRNRGHVVEYFNPWETDLSGFDIYHHFSFFRGDFPMLKYARAAGPKIVVETMYWWSWRYALFYPQPPWLRFRALVHHGIKTFLPRLTPQRKVAEAADLLVANSEIEARLLRRHLALETEKVAVVHNAADIRFAEATPDQFIDRFDLQDFVLCVGMFETRKNQLNLIRALKDTGVQLVLIGNVTPPHREYYERCLAEADQTVHFVPYLPHDDPMLASAYAAADTLVMPSWHETTGKAALEAALAGSKLAVTSFGPTREYFEDFVRYVDPRGPIRIRKAVEQSLGDHRDERLKRHVLRHFTWERAGDRRLLLYEKLLSEESSYRGTLSEADSNER